MNTIPYEVTDPDARTINGVRVENGIVALTESQAEHWLRMGAIRCLSQTFDPGAPAEHAVVTLPDEVDPYRSAPDPVVVEPRKRGRPRKVEITGASPTNFPAEEPANPPMPYLDREGEG